MDYKDGGIYEGNWKNDVRYGIGILYIIATGFFYMGMWENDRKSGYGV